VEVVAVTFANKLTFTILLIGLFVLILLSFTAYKLNNNAVIESQLLYTKSIADEVSDDIDHMLHEKVKTALTLANTPIIKKGLETSNLFYADLSGEKRNESIKLLNEKWKSAKNPSDNFILKFTDNKVSHFLKGQQAILKGEYGEIFLTNKFGALVASTSKLSTLAHGHKYWWLGAYNNGKGTVFFDDRGYDDSVGGYVLGLVVPIRKGSEILGILKCNLNILGAASNLISGAEDHLFGKFKLTRSGGMVIFEKGFDPSSTRIHDSIVQKIQNKNDESFIINDSGEKYLVGFSEINLTKGGKGFGFGGTFESLDHKKGNTGESWYIVCYRQMSVVLSQSTKSIVSIILIGTALILIIALISKLFGRTLAKPMTILGRATEKIGKGDFEYRIGLVRKDEFGNLDRAFNKMANQLQQTTTTIELLENEVKHSKQIEKTLKESENRYRSFVLNFQGIAYQGNMEFVPTFFHGAVEEITGHVEADFIAGKPRWDQIVHEDDRHIIYDNMAKFQITPNFSLNVEYRIIRKDGEVRWISEYVSNVCDDSGKPVIVQGSLFDITEHKQIEDEKALLEQNYQTIFREMLDGFALHEIICDAQGKPVDYRFLSVNPSFERMTGLKAEDLVGMTVLEVLPGTEPYWIETYGTVALTGEPAFFENYSKEIGKHFQVTAFRYAPNQFVCIFVDITSRRLAEDALRESEEKYRILVENANDAILVAQDGVGKFANQKTEELTGYSAEELARIPFVDWIHPDDRDTVMERHRRRVGGEKPVSTYSFRIIHKSGLERTVQINSVLIQWEDRPATLNFIRDITQQVNLEIRLLQAQKMETIGILAGGIAHDFNNILFPIIGNTEMVLEDIPEDSPLRSNLNEVYKASMRASELVKQILMFSRQDSNEIKLFKIQPVIKEAMKLVRSTVSASISIKQYIQSDPIIIKADPTQIHQVVMNLATNAYHAMENTGGTLKVNLKQIEMGEQDIMDPGMKPGTYACLTISDTGTGIDENVRRNIFDPFFTTKEPGKGTGMGLSVVHGIVKTAGGGIQVHSEPGRGTEFYVYLPVEMSLSVSKDPPTADPIQGGTERILLVDDEEPIVFMEKQILERLGYQVVSRTSSVEALEAFRTDPAKYDLVITDMSMPNMSGDQLSSELIKIRSDIPILLCTGFSEKIPEEKAETLGIKNYLMKPIVRKDLARKVREALG
jgi:PAS domain S-box-containing protein